VVQDQVDARSWHDHGQPPQKLDGVELDVGSSIAPRLPELQSHLSLVGHVEPLLRHRRSQGVATDEFEALPLPNRHDEAGMQIEAVPSRLTAGSFQKVSPHDLQAAPTRPESLGATGRSSPIA